MTVLTISEIGLTTCETYKYTVEENYLGQCTDETTQWKNDKREIYILVLLLYINKRLE